MEYTILCWTSAHGRSQLKQQNWRVCAYTENMLKWFNYPHVRAYPRCEVSCHGTESTCIISLSMICRGQPNNGENCIVLQSGPTCSLVAKFLQRSVVACSMWISCCRGRTLWTRPKCTRTIASMWPTFGSTTRKFSMVGGYMKNPEKPQKRQNWGVGTCPGQYSGRLGFSIFHFLGLCSQQWWKRKSRKTGSVALFPIPCWNLGLVVCMCFDFTATLFQHICLMHWKARKCCIWF